MTRKVRRIDRLAETIWHASRDDEGTISAIGADKVAARVREHLLSDGVVERAAYAMYLDRPLELDQEGGDDWAILPDDWKDEWREGARAAIEGALDA